MAAITRFEKILEPCYIGKLRTRNRMVATATGLGYYRNIPDSVRDRIRQLYYGAVSRGGVGLFVIGSATVDYPLGASILAQLRLSDDTYFSSISKLTQVVHKHGCPIFLQLMHAGAWKPHGYPFEGFPDYRQPVSASSMTENELPDSRFFPCKGLTISEIEDIVEKFGKAAERCKRASFDGVEINAATVHLLNSFLSRVWNKRQDDYGCGSLESRARIVVEIVGEIKRCAGQDFPVIVLYNAVEYGIDKGITLEEGKGFAPIIEKGGADAIYVRGYGWGEYFDIHVPDTVFYPEPPKPLAKSLDGRHHGTGVVVPLAAAVKKLVSIPVITVGKLNPVLGEKILREGKADLIGFGRPITADPELPNKVASGRLEDIAPCTRCLNCFDDVHAQRPVRCQVNAFIGGLQEYAIKKAEKKKKVMVVGGGPAGMEAARVAALRGHEVILYEKERTLGGLLRIVSLIKGRETEDLVGLVRYLKTQITKMGVKIRLGRKVNLSLIEKIKPDAVIIATGGVPTLPEISGINRHNVVKSVDLYNRKWLAGWKPLGEKVVIIGGTWGCELAMYLVKRGAKVTIVDTAKTLGDRLQKTHKKARLFNWLAKKEVAMMTEVKYEVITNKGLTIINKEGKRQTIEADTIVPIMPLAPNTELLNSLKGKVPEIYAVGDCRKPLIIKEAISSGFRTARAI